LPDGQRSRWAVRGQQRAEQPVFHLGVEDREALPVRGEDVGVGVPDLDDEIENSTSFERRTVVTTGIKVAIGIFVAIILLAGCKVASTAPAPGTPELPTPSSTVAPMRPTATPTPTRPTITPTTTFTPNVVYPDDPSDLDSETNIGHGCRMAFLQATGLPASNVQFTDDPIPGSEVASTGSYLKNIDYVTSGHSGSFVCVGFHTDGQGTTASVLIAR
jgi:hypothetical protein